DALRAEFALVEGELLPRLDADHPLVLHLQRDATLLAAEAAVRVHRPVGPSARGEAAGWFMVQVRAESVDERLDRAGELGHFRRPRLAAAQPSAVRRRAGVGSVHPAPSLARPRRHVVDKAGRRSFEHRSAGRAPREARQPQAAGLPERATTRTPYR